MNKLLGTVFCVIGVIGLVWGGFTYHTQQTLLAVGSLNATREATHSVLLPPFLGVLALIVGAFLLAVGRERRA